MIQRRQALSQKCWKSSSRLCWEGLGPEHNNPAPSSEEGRATTNGPDLKLTVRKLLFDGGASRLEYQRSKTLESAVQAEASIVVEELFLDVIQYYIDYWR